MKKIKSLKGLLLSAATILLLVTAPAIAQDKLAEGSKLVTDNMKEQLVLSDAQYKKVYDINLDFFTQAKALRSSGEDKMDKAKKMKALDDDRDVKIKAALTDKQYETYLVNKKERREKLKEQFKEARAGRAAVKE